MVTVQNPDDALFEDYVFHSFLYYALSDPVISDTEFDILCKKLHDAYRTLTHPDRALTDPDALQAGTGYQMSGKWPVWVFERALDHGVDPRSLIRELPELCRFLISVPYIPTPTFTGIGSRDAPVEILNLMKRIGKAMSDLGYQGRSGYAPGSDTAFYRGAQQSHRFSKIGFENFLPNSWLFDRPDFGNIKPDPQNNIFDATTFKDVYAKARDLALEARGSFERLGSGGIELHSRNPFQILGKKLDQPSHIAYFWAQPVGQSGKVKGGTNTAVQIALKFGVKCMNLFHEQVRKEVETFLQFHESGLLKRLLTPTPTPHSLEESLSAFSDLQQL